MSRTADAGEEKRLKEEVKRSSEQAEATTQKRIRATDGMGEEDELPAESARRETRLKRIEEAKWRWKSARERKPRVRTSRRRRPAQSQNAI